MAAAIHATRHFSSGVFPLSSKHQPGGACGAHGTVAPEADAATVSGSSPPSRSSSRSQSTPRSGSSLNAGSPLPGRPRVALPSAGNNCGSNSSRSPSSRHGSPGPGQKASGSTRSGIAPQSSRTRQDVKLSREDSNTATAQSFGRRQSCSSSSRSSSPSIGSSRAWIGRTANPATTCTESGTSAAVGGKGGGTSSSCSSTSSKHSSRTASSSSGIEPVADKPAKHRVSSLSLATELKELRQRHQKQTFVLDKDADHAPALTKPDNAATLEHFCAQVAGSTGHSQAAGVAGSVPSADVGSPPGGREYLQRLQENRLQKLAAATASMRAASGAGSGGHSSCSSSSTDARQRLLGGSSFPVNPGYAAAASGTTGAAGYAAVAAAALTRERRTSVDSPLLHHRPGTTVPDGRVEGLWQQRQQQQQPLYNPDLYDASDAGFSRPQADGTTPQQLYNPEQYMETDTRSGGSGVQQAAGGLSASSFSSLLQRQQEQLAERIAAAGAGAGTFCRAYSSPAVQQAAAGQRVRQRVGTAEPSADDNRAGRYSSSSSSATGPVGHGAAVHPSAGASRSGGDFSGSRGSRDQTSGGHQYQHLYAAAATQEGHYQHTSRQVQSQQGQVQHWDTGALSAQTTAAGRRFAHSGGLTGAQQPHSEPLRPPHPLYTVPPQQWQQQQGLQHQQSSSVLQHHSSYTAAAVGAQHGSSTEPEANDRRHSGSGSSTCVGAGGSTRPHCANQATPSSSSSSSSHSIHSMPSSTTATRPPLNTPFAQSYTGTSTQHYSDTGSQQYGDTGSVGGPAAAAAGLVQHRRSSSGGGSAAGSMAYHSSCYHQPPKQQQQQQQPPGLSRLSSAASSNALLGSRQPSFLISTQPLSDDAGDTCRPGALQSPAAVRELHSGYSAGEEQEYAASRQAAVQFFNLNSRTNSMTAEQGHALPLQQHQQQQQGLAERQSGRAAAADAYTNSSTMLKQVGATSASDQLTNGCSDTDISEVSTSVEHYSSSSSDSDSEDCAPAVPDWRRRLHGTVTLGSTVSISTEDRSSSCGSGRELEHACSSGKQGMSSLGAGYSSSGSSRGQLPQGCVGLVNLGNTCFMNSILQCLNCLPELVAALLGPGLATSLCNTEAASAAAAAGAGAAAGGVGWGAKATVGPALCELLSEVWALSGSQQGGSAAASKRRAVVSPRRFLAAVAAADERWGDGCQQDSQEFLHSLLEQLQSECNRVRSKPLYKELNSHGTVAQQAAEAAQYARSWHDSLVDDLFGGQLQSTITCSACSHASHCFDPFLDLSVPIPKNKQVSLQDCLQAFVEQEMLTGSEQVKCSACQKTCDATKRLQVFRYPRLLVLTLKRFNSGGGGRGGRGGGGTGLGGAWLGGGFSPYSKNQTPVLLDAQHVLDLEPYCNPVGVEAARSRGCCRPQYQLLAVSEHSGCLGGGHYTALGRSVADGHWYDFNDASVTPDGHPSGVSSSAYVLFFRLVGS